MKRIRVLHLLWDDNVGGAERHVLDLLTHLDRSVFDCELCVLHQDLDRIAGDARAAGIPVRHINLRSGFDLRGAGRYISYIRRERYDIIHNHAYPLWMPFALAFSTRSLNLVTLHGRKPTLRTKLMYRLGRFFTDSYLAPSSAYKRAAMELYKIPGEKILVVHHGVDVSRFDPPTAKERAEKRAELGLREHELAIGTVGRIAEEKNYPCFVRTALRVHGELPNTRFFVAGHGEDLDDIRDMVQEKGAGDYVTFLGNRTDVPELLGAWDLFLFTTWGETFGIVVAEAMAKGLVCVVSDWGSLTEVVGDAGVLVKPDDDIAFANEVVSLLRDGDRRRKMCRRARERTTRLFSMERMIDETAAIYRRLVGTRRR